MQPEHRMKRRGRYIGWMMQLQLLAGEELPRVADT
jgi:hypothetical protein